MAEHLSRVVEAGTANAVGELTATSIRCTRRPRRGTCTGSIEVVRIDTPVSIEWWCPVCGDEGVVSGWEDSPFDLRRPASCLDDEAVVVDTRPAGAPAPGPSRLSGRWRIIEMELWDQDTIDLLGPAFIEFSPDNGGSFRFIAVEAWMDVRPSDGAGCPGVEFSWEGNDEGDLATGRGRATLGSDGTLTGRIFVHLGDDYGFLAVPEEEAGTSGGRRTGLRR